MPSSSAAPSSSSAPTCPQELAACFCLGTGTGVAGNPYLVCDVASLQNVALVAAQPMVFLRLTADIELVAPHTPFPVFAGTLDGAGHTISGLNPMGGEELGLVGTLTGSISDLTLAHVTITGSAPGTYAGALAGRMTSGAIVNVAVTGVGGGSSVVGQYVAGGLVGEMTGGTITGPRVAAGVSSATVAAGGVVGRVYGGSISDARVEGSVTITAAGGAAGGVVGDLPDGTIERATILATVNTASSGAVVGGAVGRTRLGTVNLREIRSAGSVTGASCTGGLVGLTEVQGTLTVADIRVSGAVQQPVDPILPVPTVAGLLGCVGGMTVNVNRVLVTSPVTGAAARNALFGGEFPDKVQATDAFYVGTVVTTTDTYGVNLTDAAAHLPASYSSSWGTPAWAFNTGMYPELARVP